MVPAIVMAIPVLRIFQILGLKDTVAALVIVNVAFWLPLIVWLLRNFFADVPVALERAARIDGCSRLGTLFRVTIPAARPGIAAAAILILIGTWNEFLFAVILGQPRRRHDHATHHRHPELPRRAEPAAATQPARGGRDGRRDPVPRPCPAVPPPDHLRPIRRVCEGMTETRGSGWGNTHSNGTRRME